MIGPDWAILSYHQRQGWDEAGQTKTTYVKGVYFQFLKYYLSQKFSIDFCASPEDLDKITEEDDFHGAQGRRKAASQAVVQQRKILLEGSDGDSANDSEPDFATGKLYPTSKVILWTVSKMFLETINVCKAVC